jgi:hypothetical protein
MSLRAQQRVRRAVLSALGQTSSGKSAATVMRYVAGRENVSPEAVRREIRALLESGDVSVGPDLNLVASQARRLRRTG